MEHRARVPATPLTETGDPLSIMQRLAEQALGLVGADRCTLTSIDSGVIRVEVTQQRDGAMPAFVGAEYPLAMMERQPLFRDAVRSGSVVTGPGFVDTESSDASFRADLERMHRVAIVPLRRGSAVLAVLILSRREDREFDVSELERLQEIGTVAVLALHNARLLEQVEAAQRTALDALTRISRLVAASDDRAQFFEKMTETVAELTGARRAAFWLASDGWMLAQPASGFTREQVANMRIQLDLADQLRVQRVLDGEAVRFTAAEFTGDALEPLVRLMGVSNGLAVPWRTADEVIGVLMAFDAPRGWGEQEEWMLRLTARSSALVWQGYEAERRVAELSTREVGRLAEYASRVASLDEQKSEFLRLASHELRTPMTLVRGYLSMLEEGALGQLPPEAARVIPIMGARMSQMGQLVEQMLTASRVQEAGSEPDLEELDIDELASEGAHALEGLINREHRLVVHRAPGARAVADREKTELILSNLISNAIKYSPDGGTVEVSVEPDSTFVRVVVRDEGIGIAPEEMSALFRPFGRLQRPETARIEGTGLGLYLARRLARLQHGDIEVVSEPGRGSTFTLVVPAAAAAG